MCTTRKGMARLAIYMTLYIYIGKLNTIEVLTKAKKVALLSYRQHSRSKRLTIPDYPSFHMVNIDCVTNILHMASVVTIF